MSLPSYYSWIIAALYLLGTLLSNTAYIALMLIVQMVEERYNVGESQINNLSTIFLVTFFPGGILFAYIASRFNMRVCFTLGSFLLFLGCLIRWLSIYASAFTAFNLIYVGTGIIGASFAFYINFCSRVASDWFPMDKLLRITMVLSLGMSIGVSVGSIVPSFFVTQPKDIDILLLVLMITTGVMFVLTAIFARSEPDDAPNELAQQQQELNRQGASRSSLQVLKDQFSEYAILYTTKKFLLLILGFSSLNGVLNALFTGIGELLPNCGYSSTVPGILVPIMTASGLVVAMYVDRVALLITNRKRLLLLLNIILVGAILMFLGSLVRNHPLPLIIFAFIILGICLSPQIPLIYEVSAIFSTELKVSVDQSLFVLYASGQLFSIPVVQALTPAVEANNVQTCSSVVTPVAALFLGLCLATMAVFGLQKLPTIVNGVVVDEESSEDVKTALLKENIEEYDVSVVPV